MRLRSWPRAGDLPGTAQSRTLLSRGDADIEPDHPFADLLAANRTYAEGFDLVGMPGVAQAKVCVLTCMDCRIDPLAILGLKVGDIKVLRNPGGQLETTT